MKKANNRHSILFSTGRTGSTPILNILFHCLNHRQKTTYLGEYLHLAGTGVHLCDGQILLTDPAPKEQLLLEKSQSEYNIPLVKKLVSNRLSLIESIPGNYVLKTFPSDLVLAGKEFVEGDHDWYLLERKNIFDQLLSSIISLKTDQWYKPNGLAFGENSLYGDRQYFEMFEDIVWRYLEYKRRIKYRTLVFYEDFCSLKLTDFVTRLGFPPEFGLGTPQLTSRQNLIPKERILSNSKEIRKWFDGSFLRRLQQTP